MAASAAHLMLEQACPITEPPISTVQDGYIQRSHHFVRELLPTTDDLTDLSASADHLTDNLQKTKLHLNRTQNYISYLQILFSFYSTSILTVLGL